MPCKSHVGPTNYTTVPVYSVYLPAAAAASVLRRRRVINYELETGSKENIGLREISIW